MLYQRKEVTDMAIRVMIKRWVTAEKEKDSYPSSRN